MRILQLWWSLLTGLGPRGKGLNTTTAATTNRSHVGWLQVLDEPAAEQLDPTLLNLQLRALGKEAAGVKMQVLGSIPHKAPDR